METKNAEGNAMSRLGQWFADSRLRMRANRGMVPIWAVIIGVFLAVILAIVFVLAPAFFIALLIVIAGMMVLVLRRTPWGTGVGVALIVIGAALALLAQGQALSIAIVGGSNRL